MSRFRLILGPRTPPVVIPSNPGVFAMGMNLSGMENEYTAPPAQAEMAYYVSKGIKNFRLPLKWWNPAADNEGLQQTINTALNSAYMAKINTVLGYAAALGATVLLDLHMYGSGPYTTTSHPDIGSAACPVSGYADLWGRIATWALGGSGGTTYPQAIRGFDLMNEWAIADTSIPLTAQQAAITKIRQAGFTGKIYVEGNNYSGAWRWTSANDNLWQLTDPANNLIFSAHSYLDNDASGGSPPNGGFIYAIEAAKTSNVALVPTSPTVGVSRVKVFADWCALHGVRGHIGEFAVSRQESDPAGYQQWNAALDNMLAYCQQQGLECDYWSAGSGFGVAYPLDPSPAQAGNPSASDFSSAGVQASQMTVLLKYAGYTGAQPTAYRLTAPAATNGSPGTASGAWTIYYGGTLAAPATFTPNDNGAGGTFSPANVVLSGSNPTGTFTYTPPASAMTTKIAMTNNRSLIDPASILFTTETSLFDGLATPQNIVSDIKLYPRYQGPARKLRRASDGATMDFGFAGDALGQANVGKTLDTAAIATWANGSALTTVTRYDQSPNGNHMGVVVNGDTSNASSTSDYPTFIIDTDGFPTDVFSSSRMDMYSPLSGAAGQTIIANFNHVSGAGLLNWDFVSSIDFGPTHYLMSDGSQGHPAYENGTLALGVISGEYHVHAATWQASQSNGWRSWRDGALFAKSNSYTAALTVDYNRNTAHLGYGVFSGISAAFKVRDLIVWSAAIPDAANLAIQNYLASHYGTTAATDNTPVAWDIVLDFLNNSYVVDGNSVALSAVTSGGPGRDAQGLLTTSATNLIGAALSALAGAAFTIEMEYANGPSSIDSASHGLLALRKGTPGVNVDISDGLFSPSAQNGAAGGNLAINYAAKDFTVPHRFAISSTPAGWSAANGEYVGSTTTALTAGWTSAALAYYNFPSGARITHVKIKRTGITPVKMLIETLPGVKGTALAKQYFGVNEASINILNNGSFNKYGTVPYWKNNGASVLRIPVNWENMQTSLGSALNGSSMSELDGAVSACLAVGMMPLIDCHNYGQYPSSGPVIGASNGPTIANLADLFAKLATRYSDARVGFDVMNEPSAFLSQAQWWSGMQQVLTAIRNTGHTGVVLLPSLGSYSDPGTFITSGGAAALSAQGGITDAANNWAISVHKYIGNNANPSYAPDTATAANRYDGRGADAAALAYCRAKGWKLWHGEIGVSIGHTSYSLNVEVAEFLDFAKANNDVFMGVTVWAGGAGWSVETNHVTSYDNGYTSLTDPFAMAAYAKTYPTSGGPYGERQVAGIMRRIMTT